MAGKCTANALIRVDGVGGDLAIIAGLLGDREYWDQTLLPVRRLLDLGANIGLASLWFSVISPGVQTACVEPDPRNIQLLEANLSRNNLHASIFACAVDACSGQVEFGLNSHTGCSSLTSTGLHKHYQTVPVQVRTVSEILDELGWDTVDLIKMDVEGAEHTILESCSEWIERVGRIVLEIHPTTTPEAIAGMMHPFGFVIRRIGYGIEPTFILERAEK
jgi:FkbM family methyltransferase